MKIKHLFLIIPIFISGCSTILIRPAIDQVKKVGIVTIYMNDEFYNVDRPGARQEEKDFEQLLDEAEWAEGSQIDDLDFTEELNEIISHGFTTFNEEFSKVPRWEVVPIGLLLSHPAYGEFVSNRINDIRVEDFLNAVMDEKYAEWVTPKGIHFIPVSPIMGDHKFMYGEDMDPTVEGRKALGKLCQALDIDGAILIHLDMGFKLNKLVTVALGETSLAKPSASFSMVLINRDGDIAINTGPIEVGGGHRYEGETLRMYKEGRVILSKGSGKPVEGYKEVVDEMADNLRSWIVHSYKRL